MPYLILLNKPKGVTSFHAVARVRRALGEKRIGHTGTLDPMATGVLVLLLGRAAKAAEYLSVHDKCYEAVLELGKTTDTEDTTGKILSTCADIPPENAVFEAALSFQGAYMQTPPMYSALKVNGQKLLDLARQGVTVERKAREVTIYALGVKKTESKAQYTLSVHCSSGTYIRTLCADIGEKLRCGGVMAALRRTKTGDFSLDDCHTLEDLEAMTAEARIALLLPTERLFGDLAAVHLPAFYERLCRSGCEIYQKKIGRTLENGTRVRICTETGMFFALGEVRDFEGGSAIKPIKFFEI